MRGLFQPHTDTVSIGSLHSCGVDVADLKNTFELPAFACLIDVNNAQSRRAASRSMWAATQGIGSSERHKNPMTRRRNIVEIRRWVVTRPVGERKANLSIGMRQLNGIYTQSFNRRHNRVGHLFQGRFKAILVEKESHLLELCRYVVLNPARVKRSGTAQTWKWSSYGATAGLALVPSFLSTDWVLEQFGQSRSRAQK